jgi:putative membrane protein
MSMKTILPIAAALLFAGGSLAIAQDTSGQTDQSGQTTVKPLEDNSASQATAPMAAETKVDTATFVKKVPSSNEFEIQSSKLALDKASADDVKKFAQQMVDDHTKAGEDFKAALERVETTSATTPSGSMLQPEQQKMLDELKGLSGDEFQARYIDMQAQAHKDAVAMFSAYANSGDDPALKEFAKKTLPTLQMHEEHVKELQSAHQG